ncbi:hypothetical protein O0I10_011789 [Lichtheimia ornata]|uniref:F-box domain-containing protein n=1 Tax=Lichtheimia ornata TaxID=688661 RepID=A0AAD7US62_9FUNG|nr:uncharacterized protein O0I10_011789 [Lichtheimia ornata]KAJ8652584.1 hypothetical protein O0I10_011789 [Lichtheimia ornata]
MTHGMMVDVLARCPSLRALSMLRCNQSHSLRVIHEHCPLLSYLRYGPLRGEYENDYLDFDSYDFASHTKPGLKKIALVANYSMYDIAVSATSRHIGRSQYFSYCGYNNSL